MNPYYYSVFLLIADWPKANASHFHNTQLRAYKILTGFLEGAFDSIRYCILNHLQRIFYRSDLYFHLVSFHYFSHKVFKDNWTTYLVILQFCFENTTQSILVKILLWECTSEDRHMAYTFLKEWRCRIMLWISITVQLKHYFVF